MYSKILLPIHRFLVSLQKRMQINWPLFSLFEMSEPVLGTGQKTQKVKGNISITMMHTRHNTHASTRPDHSLDF